MRFVTLADGSRDGRLYIVSTDGARIVEAQGVTTMQDALEHWERCLPHWQAQCEGLEQDSSSGMGFDPSQAESPLPRAWQWLDGSAFETHAKLLQESWGMPVVGLNERPLMYQGLSDRFLPPQGTAKFPSDQDGIDFEGEFGVILDAVPMGTSADQAGQYIRLVVLINDWSLRALGPTEMATGFGWLQCKPASTVAPLAVTPDELGEAWQDHRVCLPLEITVNGTGFGAANGREMKFGFDELIAHAAYSRDLPAGTVLGSGTVANVACREVGSSCIAERRAIEQIDTGNAVTPYLGQGDRVRMQVSDAQGRDLFSAIDQTVLVVAPD